MKFLLVGINSKYIHTNLALFYLESYAKEYCDKEISDCITLCEYTINQPLEKILQEINLEKPNIIGFSCYIWNIRYVKELIEMVHKAMPNVDIWLGGPEVSFYSEKQMEQLSYIKGIMIGEGEAGFKEVLESYYTVYKNDAGEKDLDTLLEKVKSLVFRKNSEIISTPLRPYLDLSTVPFPYKNLKQFENRILYYETSRGCPFRCKYCLSSVDKKVRLRDINLVKEELQFFIDNKVQQVKFVDRTFNARKDHALSIWRYIKEHDNGITNFHFEIAADLMDDEMISEIKDMRSELIQLEIGVQSTNETTISHISRKTSIEEIENVTSKIRAFHNTHQHLDLIVGLPYEDYESFGRSFDDVYKMNPSQLQVGFLKVLKGSAMEFEAEEYGIIYRDQPPYEVIKTKWISYNDICKLKDIEEVVETYYNSGQYVNAIKALSFNYARPFIMYEELAKFFRNCGYFDMTPSREKKYNRLLKFYEYTLEKRLKNGVVGNCDKENEPTLLKAISEYVEAFRQVLVIDYYTREKAKKHPSFADNKYEWNKDKTIHTEIFKYDIKYFLEKNVLKHGEYRVNIDYTCGKDFLSNYPWIVK